VVVTSRAFKKLVSWQGRSGRAAVVTAKATEEEEPGDAAPRNLPAYVTPC